MGLTERHAETISSRIRDVLLDMERRGEISTRELAELGDEVVSRRAVEYALLRLRHPDRRNPIAERVGPIYTLGELRGWLTPPGDPPLTAEAVRKRAVRRQLVAFRTDDNQWVFPAWQFAAVAGYLVVNKAVVALWKDLPHDGWRSAGTLAAWMHTRLHSMDGDTPAVRARTHGVDDPIVRAAVGRLSMEAAA